MLILPMSRSSFEPDFQEEEPHTHITIYNNGDEADDSCAISRSITDRTGHSVLKPGPVATAMICAWPLLHFGDEWAPGDSNHGYSVWHGEDVSVTNTVSETESQNDR